MTIKKALAAILALAAVFTTITTSAVTAGAAFASADYAIWPAKNVNITQGPNGGYSHKGVNNFDIVTSDNNIIAPFDCKVVAIFKSKESGNSVVVQSKKKVHLANGTTNYVCLNTGHDNNINDLYVGKEIKQGVAYYQTGTYGNVSGRHCDCQVMIGAYSDKKCNPFFAKNKYGNWYSPNSVSPEKVFFIKSGTKTNNAAGLKFKTLETNISKATITVTDKVFTGKSISAASFVTSVTLNGIKLVAGTDYTVSLNKSATIIGVYTVTITGKNGYTGYISKKVSIIPGNVTLNSLSVKKLVITAKFTTIPGCKTQIKVTGSDGSSTTFVSSGKGSCTIKTVKGKNLKKGVTYTVSCRAICENASNTTNSTCVTLYSAKWSASKSIKAS